ncbi:MAG: E3 ubiquitin ligase family protein [Leptolyngbyaceae bacterium]|nr:E3 ubiquitin ligase family protein [Leptolyngbyaceae bacterium]
MTIFGVILLVVAIILFFVYRSETNKAFNLQSARPSTTAELKNTAMTIADDIGRGNWRDYVKVWGEIECDRPLTSPLKQLPCVAYSTTVTWEYEETRTVQDDDGNPKTETDRKTETISSDRQSVPFLLKDETGTIQVNPDDADMEMTSIVNEFQPEHPRGEMLSFGSFSLDVSRYSRQSSRRTVGYRYRETILPVDRHVLVVGTVSDESNTLVIQKPINSSQTLIISFKNDEAMTADAKKGAQQAFYGMVGCGVLGGILLIVGLVSG